MGLLLFSGTLVVSACEYEGKTPGFWKNHRKAWKPTGYTPDMLIEDFFIVPPSYSQLADDNLLEVLKYKGNRGNGARQLLRHAVAGMLNSAHPDVNYIYTLGDIQWLVNYALSTGNPDVIERNKNLIEQQNELEAEF